MCLTYITNYFIMFNCMVNTYLLLPVIVTNELQRDKSQFFWEWTSSSQTQNAGNSSVPPLPKSYILNAKDHPGLSLYTIPLTDTNNLF